MIIQSNNECSFKWLISLMLLQILCTACTSIKQDAALPASESLLQATHHEGAFELSKKASEAYAQSNWFDAIRFYQALTQNLPEDAYSWFRLANSYAHQGDFEKAIASYQRSLQYDASQARTWFNLSTALLLSAQDALRRSGHNISSSDAASNLLKLRLKELDHILSRG